MVDSLPPSGTSGTDPDNETIITNSNGKLSVPLADASLAVRSSGTSLFGSTWVSGSGHGLSGGGSGGTSKLSYLKLLALIQNQSSNQFCVL